LNIGFYIFYDFRYIVYNTKLTEILQYSPNALEDLIVGDVVFERERKSFKNHIANLQDKQTDAFDCQLTIIKGNKEISSIQYHAFMTTIGKHPIGVAYLLDEKDHDINDKFNMKVNYSIIIELQSKVEELLRLSQISSEQPNEKKDFREDLYFQYGVTKREQEVLKLIYNGYSNQQIADKLFISKRTVEFHRSNLMEKTGTKNGIELLHFAVKTKLIDSDHQMDHFPEARN
jgi:DNA-binding CsgD family transcriptional regulator